TLSGEAATEARELALSTASDRLSGLSTADKPDTAAISRAAVQVGELSRRVDSTESLDKAVSALQSAAVALPQAESKAIAVDLIRDLGVTAAERKDLGTAQRSLTAIENLKVRPDFQGLEGRLIGAQDSVRRVAPALESRATLQ